MKVWETKEELPCLQMLAGKVRVCIIDADYSRPTYDLHDASKVTEAVREWVSQKASKTRSQKAYIPMPALTLALVLLRKINIWS